MYFWLCKSLESTIIFMKFLTCVCEPCEKQVNFVMCVNIRAKEKGAFNYYIHLSHWLTG